MGEKSRLRQTISRWANSADQHDRDLRKDHHSGQNVPIGEAEDRVLVQLQGTLRTVTLRPRGGVPALEAELYDGTGAITLIWLGRRRIGGVVPGRAVRVRGRIGRHDDLRVLYNPHYELVP